MAKIIIIICHTCNNSSVRFLFRLSKLIATANSNQQVFFQSHLQQWILQTLTHNSVYSCYNNFPSFSNESGKTYLILWQCEVSTFSDLAFLCYTGRQTPHQLPRNTNTTRRFWEICIFTNDSWSNTAVHVSSVVETLRPPHIAQTDTVTVCHCTTVHIICTPSNGCHTIAM